MDNYIYVNYAYEDRDDVSGLIDGLSRAGLNIVSSGNDDKIAVSLFVLNICSRSSRTSKTWRRVTNYINRHAKDCMQIHLDGGRLVSDIDSQLQAAVQIFKYKYKSQTVQAGSSPEEEKPGLQEPVQQTSPREQAYEKAMKLMGEGASQEDMEKGAEYLLQSANQGYAPAQYQLSICFDEGKGVKASASEALRWREMAAYGGVARAQCEMGYCYECGRGVVRNIREAVRWYTTASDQGDMQAKNNLAFCYQKGHGVVKDTEMAISLYTEAADAGLASAQYNLGYCCWYGEGTAIDKERAVDLFRRSMEGGNFKAAQMIKLLEQYEHI